MLKTLNDIPDVKGKKILVRSELNVPIKNGEVSDIYRIEKAMPTLEWLSSRGAKVVVVAHLGRKPEASLRPVYERMKKMMPGVKFVSEIVGESVTREIEILNEGEVLLLENLRSNAGEKKNDEDFAKELARYGDYFVNDAFGVTHRSHASIVGVPKFVPSFAGLLLETELKELEKGLKPDSPSVFILGGAKFETKEPLLEAIIERYDTIFVGGALANDFFKAGGFNVGKSLVSEGLDKVDKIMATGKIMLPSDVVVENENGVVPKRSSAVNDSDMIVDIGPESVTELGVKVSHANCIVWNGPLGFYEKGYIKSTENVAQIVADADGYSIVGGGDTVASIRGLGLEKKMDFVSTGGGAMLDYLVDGKLVGVEALEASHGV